MIQRTVNRLGWMLMGVPWWSTSTCVNANPRGWHWRLYFFGARLHNWER